MGLAGYPSIANSFIADNTDAWTEAGQNNWANSGDYPLDGYTLLVELDLLDTHGVAICLSETSDTIVDTSKDFMCFGVSYNSSLTNKTARFTDVIGSAVNFNEASVASSRPSLAQANSKYNSACGDSTGYGYYGGGVSECWGISTGEYVDPFGYVHISAYLFLPKEYSDEETFGWRW